MRNTENIICIYKEETNDYIEWYVDREGKIQCQSADFETWCRTYGACCPKREKLIKALGIERKPSLTQDEELSKFAERFKGMKFDDVLRRIVHIRKAAGLGNCDADSIIYLSVKPDAYGIGNTVETYYFGEDGVLEGGERRVDGLIIGSIPCKKGQALSGRYKKVPGTQRVELIKSALKEEFGDIGPVTPMMRGIGLVCLGKTCSEIIDCIKNGDEFAAEFGAAANIPWLTRESHENACGFSYYVFKFNRPVFGRYPENRNKKTFDFVNIDLTLRRGTKPNDLKPFANSLNSFITKNLEATKAFTKYGIPAGFLKADRMVIGKDSHLYCVLSLKMEAAKEE